MPESIGSIFPTQIPSLTENANIQDALKIFHYGTKTPPTSISQLAPASVAGHLQSANVRLTALEALGIGSIYSTNEPTAKVDGSIWVKSNSNAPIYQNFFVASYQPTEPTEFLENGAIWINSTTKAIKVYDDVTEEWETVSSGSSVGAVATINLTGLNTSVIGLDSVTAMSQGVPPIFGYLSSGVPVPLALSINTTKNNPKIDVNFNFAKALPSAAGNILLTRSIGLNPAAPLAYFYFDGSSAPKINYVDEVVAPEGSTVTYLLQNAATETITFDGQSVAYTIQAIAKEIG